MIEFSQGYNINEKWRPINACNYIQNNLVTTVSGFVCYDANRLIRKFGFQGSKMKSKLFLQMKLPYTIDT